MVTDVRLKGVTLRHNRFPEPITDVSGRLRIDGTKLTLSDMTATYAGASLAVSGMIRGSSAESTDDATIADLRVAVEGLPLVAAVRDVLPEGWRRAWDDARPAGVVDLDIASLRCTESPDGAHDVWTVDGRAVLHDLSVAGVLDLKEIGGAITVEGLAIDSLGGLILAGDLDMRRGDVLGRRIEDVHGQWSWIRQADGVGRLELSGLVGRMYDGSVMAEHVRVHMTPPKVTYDIQATAHSVELERFVTGEHEPIGEGIAPGEDYGWIDAQLSLTGTVGDPFSRRGWGGFDILDAKIYKLPIIWKILTFLNITTPMANEAFNHATARFKVVGDRMDLEDILLRGPALAFEGRGHMTLPDRHVNIELRPVSDPTAWHIPIISEIIQGAARGIVGLRVTGPLSDPTVYARSLPGVDDTLHDLFVKKKDDRRR